MTALKIARRKFFLMPIAVALVAVTVAFGGTPALADDPLPSWNEGAAKAAILAFVKDVTEEGGPRFVPVEERVAVFDNDGTLWGEQPMYVQGIFALERVKQMAPDHPEWKDEEPFKSILAGGMKAALAGGDKAIAELVMATHAGMSSADFDKMAAAWLETAKHPGTGRLYTDMVYQPMLELLAYLRANGFKTFIVTGGGVEFVRAFSERVYGIPTEQVIGSSIKLKYEMQDGKPVLMRLPEIFLIDDKDGKPVGIQQYIGRQPIAAFGNSDGDLEMLQWVTARDGARFGLIVHHTDAVREYAYDRNSDVGHLAIALDDAGPAGWTVVDMKYDWKIIYPPE